MLTGPETASIGQLIGTTPVLFAVVFAVVILLVVIGRVFGFTAIGDKAKLVDNSKVETIATGVAAIGTKVAEIEKRIGVVEYDVTQRATRDEMHRLELSFARLEGELKSQAMTIQSTANAINRIEDFMYTAATRLKQGSG